MIKATIVMDAYRKANGIPKDQYVVLPSWLVPFVEEYAMQNALDQIKDAPTQWLPFERPANKAKEIALEAALRITPAYFDAGRIGGFDAKILTERAESIYLWLTEPETDNR